MQNEKSGKLDKFFAGKGFYIVLALCVIVIGISAYSLVKGADDTGVGLDPGISAARQTERPEPSAEPPVSTEKRWMLRARTTSFRPERSLRTMCGPNR